MTAQLIERGEISLILMTDREALRVALNVISDLVRGLIPSEELLRFQLAFQEVLTNAFEHGNLGISAAEKIALCEKGQLEAEHDRRTPSAAQKRIRVSASIAGAQFVCTVADEGAGFNWRELSARPLSAADLTNPSGRGLAIIRAMFDAVEYNDGGTAVTLKKTFRRK